MATVKLYFDDRFIKKDGTAPVVLVVRNRGGQSRISTGISIPPQCWDGTKVIKVKGVNIDHTALNQQLKVLLAKAEVFMHETCGRKTRMTSQNIRDRIEAMLDGRKVTEGERNNFMDVFTEYVELTENEESKYSHRGKQGYLMRALPKAETITFEDIDEFWVEDLKSRMLKGGKNCKPLKSNTARDYMTYVKSVYRYAIRKGYIEAPARDPFISVKFKKSAVKKRCMPIEDLRYLWNVDLKKLKCKSNKSKDFERSIMCLRLIFTLCGINLQDLFYLTKDDIVGGRLQTVRSKTGVPIDVKLEPEALKLISELKSKDGRLIGKLIGKDDTVRALASRINGYAKKVLPYLTMYWMRHSWMSVGVWLDISDRTLSMGLAHSYGNAMDNVYITNDNKKLDIANRKILDYVLEKGEFAPKDNEEGEK